MPHNLLLPASADESSRELYARALIAYLDRDLRPRLKTLYETRVRPQLGARPGRREIAQAMRQTTANEWYSGLRAIAQRQSYRATGAVVARQLPELTRRAAAARLGRLDLDASLRPPAYATALETHHMPGNYHAQRGDGDVFAGALFDRQITVNRQGVLGALNDDAGVSLAAWVAERFPGLRPLRILEMGCTVGHTTLAFKQAFPEAHVHAIDIAAACLRYARARAASLGVEVDFSQQDAEKTTFDDGSFDLVFTRILMHETSASATRRIFAEAHRLARPGGLVFHSEGAPFDEMEPYAASLREWDIAWNNEPFMETYYDMPLERMMAQAGFAPEAVFRDYAPSMHVRRSGLDPALTLNGGRYFLVGAVRS